MIIDTIRQSYYWPERIAVPACQAMSAPIWSGKKQQTFYTLSSGNDIQLFNSFITRAHFYRSAYKSGLWWL